MTTMCYSFHLLQERCPFSIMHMKTMSGKGVPSRYHEGIRGILSLM